MMTDEYDDDDADLTPEILELGIYLSYLMSRNCSFRS